MLEQGGEKSQKTGTDGHPAGVRRVGDCGYNWQLTVIQGQTDQLLNLRLLEEIDADTFAAKSTELRDRAARLKLQAEVLDRGHDENADIAIKAFELSQSLISKWVTADYAAKRQILEIVCLNWRLDGVTLCPIMRKPFDVLAEGLTSKESRGDKI
jgi:site-specific DNA recombinase